MSRSRSRFLPPSAHAGMYVRVFTVFMCLAVPFSMGCSSDPQEPEVEIRRAIEEAEAAAAAKDVSSLARIVSDQYTDGRGFTRQSVSGLMSYYLNRYQRVHLFTRIKEISVTDPENAHVDIVVALAGQPIGAPDELSNLRADLYRFNLRFVKDGSERWQIVRADWRRAQPPDFL